MRIVSILYTILLSILCTHKSFVAGNTVACRRLEEKGLSLLARILQCSGGGNLTIIIISKQQQKQQQQQQ